MDSNVATFEFVLSEWSRHSKIREFGCSFFQIRGNTGNLPKI